MRYSFQALLKSAFCLICILYLPIAAKAQTDETTAADRRQFQDIASRLDLGGNLMLVLNTDAVIDRFMEAAIDNNEGALPDDPHEKEVRETITRFHNFLTRNGVAGIHGVGISTVPLNNGKNKVKFFISRDYVDSNLPFWRGVVGWQPRRLLGLDFLPAGTAMTRAGTPDPAALWKVIKSVNEEVMPQPSRERFNAIRKSIEEIVGMNIDELVGSLRDEILFAVRFSPDSESLIPTKSGLVTIPTPEFLIIVGGDGNILRGVAEAQLSKHKLTITESKIGDIIIRSTQNKVPSPISLQPAYALQDGFFLLGSSQAIVADALLAYRHKNGLLTRPEFKNAFRGLSMVNNGLVYISQEMGEVLAHVKNANAEYELKHTANHPATERMMKQLLTYEGQAQSCALTIQNWKSGVMVMGTSALGSKDLLTRLAANPARLLLAHFGKNRKDYISWKKLLSPEPAPQD